MNTALTIQNQHSQVQVETNTAMKNLSRNLEKPYGVLAHGSRFHCLDSYRSEGADLKRNWMDVVAGIILIAPSFFLRSVLEVAVNLPIRIWAVIKGIVTEPPVAKVKAVASPVVVTTPPVVSHTVVDPQPVVVPDLPKSPPIVQQLLNKIRQPFLEGAGFGVAFSALNISRGVYLDMAVKVAGLGVAAALPWFGNAFFRSAKNWDEYVVAHPKIESKLKSVRDIGGVATSVAMGSLIGHWGAELAVEGTKLVSKVASETLPFILNSTVNLLGAGAVVATVGFLGYRYFAPAAKTAVAAAEDAGKVVKKGAKELKEAVKEGARESKAVVKNAVATAPAQTPRKEKVTIVAG